MTESQLKYFNSKRVSLDISLHENRITISTIMLFIESYTKALSSTLTDLNTQNFIEIVADKKKDCRIYSNKLFCYSTNKLILGLS